MKEERKILAHPPVPLYRKAFFIAVVVGFSYLGFIFLKYVL